METRGGSDLRRVLDDLEDRLVNYLGQLNEIKAGLKVKSLIPKPPELIKFEQSRILNLPLWAGGLQDQPHIWLEMFSVISNTLTVFDAIEKHNNQNRS